MEKSIRKRPKYNNVKALEAATYLLSLRKKQISIIKLLHMLYIADFMSIQKYERMMTWDRYTRGIIFGVCGWHVRHKIITSNRNISNWDKYITFKFGECFLKKIKKPAKLSESCHEILDDVYFTFYNKDGFHMNKFKELNGRGMLTDYEMILATGTPKKHIDRIIDEWEQNCLLDEILNE